MSDELNCLIWINEMIQKCPKEDLPSFLKNIAFINDENGKPLGEISIDKVKEIKKGFKDYIVKRIEKETLKPIPYETDTSDYLNPYVRYLIGAEQFSNTIVNIAKNRKNNLI